MRLCEYIHKILLEQKEDLMDYILSEEIAEVWGVSVRNVQRLLSEGRVPGAVKKANRWLVPADAVKPDDPRRHRKSGHKNKPLYYLASMEIQRAEPHGAIPGESREFEKLAEADLAYRRGNQGPAKEYFLSKDDSDESKLTAACLATVAAISSGDYDTYDEVQAYVERLRKVGYDEASLLLISLPETVAAVSMSAPGMTPQWLKNMDFSMFPKDLTPFLLSLYILHLRNIGDVTSALAVARTYLALRENETTFNWMDLNDHIACAIFHYDLGEEEQAEASLCAAMDLGLPCGMITPFADSFTMLGSLMDKCLQRLYPEYRKPVEDLWESSFKNWISFHNKFTRENITTLLTAQEYQIAYLAAKGATYKEIAKRMHLSAGRVKNVLTGIYGKLCIEKKSQLKNLVV
ncbi:LuxR C-terminal-related transcriptional regulator [Aminicella lysinilytica]|uniref:LuxR C-terminal-related transcriptional regulator n=1 Tax=Aminicella lysinilytica TaxID=433323 RepID=UPI0026F2DCFF|nr:LuxR C-terminal-related transcriptional regulator [Aminicella lysinilytica]